MSNARQLAANLPREGGLSNRNLIINGAMQVAQRGTSFTNYAGYTLDRWFIGNPATNSISQQYDNTIGMYYMDATTSAAWGIFQWVENLNVRHLKAGDKVTVSYWVNTSSDTFQIKTTNTNDDNYTPSVIETAGSWYRKAAVVTITSAQVSDIQSSAHLRFQFSPNQNSFQITGVQLEVGDTATPFEHRSYGQELALCQRFFWRGDIRSGYRYAQNIAVGPKQWPVYFSLPVQMRAYPSGTAAYTNFDASRDGGLQHITNTQGMLAMTSSYGGEYASCGWDVKLDAEL